MATNTFKSYPALNITSAGGTMYTVPASTTAVLLGVNVANGTGSAAGTAGQTIRVTLTRSGVEYNYVPPGALNPVGGGLSPVGVEGKHVLQANDILKVYPSAGAVDTLVSVLEMS